MAQASIQPSESETALQPPKPLSPLAAQTETADRHTKLLSDFKAALDRLVDAATGQAKIDEDSAELVALARALERILHDGFRGRRQWLLGGSSATGSQGLWTFVRSSLESAADSRTGASELVATVQAVTENMPETRIRTWILMALMQQQLGQHIQILSDTAAAASAKESSALYRQDAMVLTADKISPVVDLLNGLTRLEFNLCLRDPVASSPTVSPTEAAADGQKASGNQNLTKRPSMSQLLRDRSEEALKTGIAATWSTFGRMQAGVGAARNLIADAAANTRSISFSGITRIPGPATAPPNTKTEIGPLSATQEAMEKLISDQHEMSQKIEELQDALSREHRLRLAVEVELVSVKMVRDKELSRLHRDISRLENQLAVFRMNPTDTQTELAKVVEERDLLRERIEQLERHSVASASENPNDVPDATQSAKYI